MQEGTSSESQAPVRCIIIGFGGIVRGHLKDLLTGTGGPAEVVAIVDPSEKTAARAAAQFEVFDVAVPPVYADLEEALAKTSGANAAMIASPHNLHVPQSKRCMEAGLDVLVEKPMAINGAEAEELLKVRDATGRHLVIAYNGSLSRAFAKVRETIAQGVIGKMQMVTMMVWQSWIGTRGTWRQVPEISGGGMLFDTGSHIINSLMDLTESEPTRMSAYLDNCGTPVDIDSVINGTLANGAQFSISCCGSTVRGMDHRSTILGEKGAIDFSAWGGRCDIRTADGDFVQHHFNETDGRPWTVFCKVRRGEMTNPSPAENGVRVAHFMDRVYESAVRVDQA